MIETSKFIIGDIMTKNLVGVDLNTTAKAAAKVMEDNEVSSLVVRENDEVVGIVTDKDFAKKAESSSHMDKVKIRDMMTRELIVVDSKLSLLEAAEITRKQNIRHLLVKSSNGFVGIISVKDILSTLYEELRDQNKELKRKIDDLEKFYKIAVDRELIMVKLKKRINELEKKLGEPSDMAEYLVK